MAESPLKPTPDTKERLLDAAEALFADHGFTATSLRSVTTAAEANLAGVNYHFGSKEGLFDAVLARVLRPINGERLRLLDALEAEGPPPLESILRAFLGPVLRWEDFRGEKAGTLMRLLGHASSDPNPMVRDLVFHQFSEVFLRFRQALGRALETEVEVEVVWGLVFTVGTMAHTMAMAHDLERFAPQLQLDDADRLLDRMVAYSAAGMRALGQPDEGA